MVKLKKNWEIGNKVEKNEKSTKRGGNGQTIEEKNEPKRQKSVNWEVKPFNCIRYSWFKSRSNNLKLKYLLIFYERQPPPFLRFSAKSKL